MGNAISVTFGRFTFPSKKLARAALSALRDTSPEGVPLVDPDSVDLLLGVVASHPQSVEKVGVGIAEFYVAKSPDWPTRCFYIRRTDGTHTDFSWNEALTPTSPLTRLRMACRNAIEDQKTAFRDKEWPDGIGGVRICPITSKPFARAECHVDHTPPNSLSRMVGDWLSSERLALHHVPIVHTGDLRSVDVFGQSGQQTAWRDYHAVHAQLRLVSAEGNLRQGARLLDLTVSEDDSA